MTGVEVLKLNPKPLQRSQRMPRRLQRFGGTGLLVTELDSRGLGLSVEGLKV